MVRLKLNLQNKAFSLLEVIITVAILSSGIIVIIQALSFSVRVTGLSCDITNAVFLAEDKIQELEFREKQNLIKEEELKDKKDKFDWEYTINPEPDLSLGKLALYKLYLNIAWQRANQKEELSFYTFLKNETQ